MQCTYYSFHTGIQNKDFLTDDVTEIIMDTIVTIVVIMVIVVSS